MMMLFKSPWLSDCLSSLNLLNLTFGRVRTQYSLVKAQKYVWFFGAIAFGLMGTGGVAHAASPDPIQIAQGYYDICPRAEVVHTYETRNYWVSICKGMDDSLFYRGVNRHNTELSINLFDLLVIDQYTYRARNLDEGVTYDISPDELVVRQNGQVILREAVIQYQ